MVSSAVHFMHIFAHVELATNVFLHWKHLKQAMLDCNSSSLAVGFFVFFKMFWFENNFTICFHLYVTENVTLLMKYE